MGEGADTC